MKKLVSIYGKDTAILNDNGTATVILDDGSSSNLSNTHVLYLMDHCEKMVRALLQRNHEFRKSLEDIEEEMFDSYELSFCSIYEMYVAFHR